MLANQPGHTHTLTDEDSSETLMLEERLTEKRAERERDGVVNEDGTALDKGRCCCGRVGAGGGVHQC